MRGVSGIDGERIRQEFRVFFCLLFYKVKLSLFFFFIIYFFYVFILRRQCDTFCLLMLFVWAFYFHFFFFLDASILKRKTKERWIERNREKLFISILFLSVLPAIFFFFTSNIPFLCTFWVWHQKKIWWKGPYSEDE